MINVDPRRMGWPLALLYIDAPTEYVHQRYTAPHPPMENQKERAELDGAATKQLTVNLVAELAAQEQAKKDVAELAKRQITAKTNFVKAVAGAVAKAGKTDTPAAEPALAAKLATLARIFKGGPKDVILNMFREFKELVSKQSIADYVYGRFGAHKFYGLSDDNLAQVIDVMFNIIVGRTDWKLGSPKTPGWYVAHAYKHIDLVEKNARGLWMRWFDGQSFSGSIMTSSQMSDQQMARRKTNCRVSPEKCIWLRRVERDEILNMTKADNHDDDDDL